MNNETFIPSRTLLHVTSAALVLGALLSGCGMPDEAEVLEAELEARVDFEYREVQSGAAPGIVAGDFQKGACGREPDGTFYGNSQYSRAGEAFQISDDTEDSQSPGTVWRIRNGSGEITRRGVCRNPNGFRSFGYCNYQFPEAGTVEFRVCRCNGSAENCRLPGAWSNCGGDCVNHSTAFRKIAL